MYAGMCVPAVRAENTSIRGSRIPPLERVFNRIDTSAQSLYARARIGIVCLDMIAEMTSFSDPLHLPLDLPGTQICPFLRGQNGLENGSIRGYLGPPI